MSTSSDRANKAARFLHKVKNVDQLMEKIKGKKPNSHPNGKFPIEGHVTKEGTEKRLEYLKHHGKEFQYLTGDKTFSDLESLHGNIENFIGFSMVPTGVIGPLNIIGTDANGDFYVPLATSEGALVASYGRGARASRMAGGITSICIIEGVQRSPVFKFDNIASLGEFVMWVLKQAEKFHEIVAVTSRHAQLIDMKTNIEGNHLILTFDYLTGDAAGQNMVTLVTDAICQYIVRESPVKPVFWFIESNYSGDKKATALSFSSVRGKKVTAEVEIPQDIVKSVLRTTTQNMVNYWQSSTLGVIQSGAIGAQGHVANGLCALFIATGQDAACTAEAAVGITRMEMKANGDLYACLTLPNLVVGTVGGGTSLPTQRECLELLDCYGAGKGRKFAEICGALALAGELSIAAALSAGHFSQAHKKFGRKQKEKSTTVLDK
ncbi:MAG: hydroxymethylglutaryl-CoA reductase [Bacteroidia bacterium]|nr:hydroxymethylglutaryl-CoA reductase [Bacteroidia bacterium]